ncbi:MAG: sulfur oxidation c-type cytochrome SoxX [Methylomicrobium sp.]
MWLSFVLLVACASIDPDRLQQGQQIAFERSRGNCLACHQIEDGESPGNIGPPLANIASKFESKQQLKQQIWDATQFNPQTSMPPFGRNKLLTDDEIEKLIDYLWSI